MRRFACTLASLALVTLVSAPALADCIPGTTICASAGLGVTIPAVQLGGQISVELPPIVLPLPFPAAPAPAAPAYPAYPSYAPPQAYPQAAPPSGYYAQRPAYGTYKLALDLRFDGAPGFGGDRYHQMYGLGGAGLGLRYRAFSHLGFEAGVDVLGGRDYNGDRTVEVAVTGGAVVYVNPRSRAQLYFSGGALVDSAHATDPLSPQALSYTHLGGYAGLGLEMFATKRVAFHLDARGFVRERVGGDAPEFTDPATGRTTNTSGGLIGSAGMLVYF